MFMILQLQNISVNQSSVEKTFLNHCHGHNLFKENKRFQLNKLNRLHFIDHLFHTKVIILVLPFLKLTSCYYKASAFLYTTHG
jgi:hypothetical protein